MNSLTFLENLFNIVKETFTSIPSHEKELGPLDRLKWHYISVTELEDEALDKTSFGNTTIHPKMLGLNLECERFLYENFSHNDFHILRKQRGFFNIVEGIQFKNKEDALAFKLRWT